MLDYFQFWFTLIPRIQPLSPLTESIFINTSLGSSFTLTSNSQQYGVVRIASKIFRLSVQSLSKWSNVSRITAEPKDVLMSLGLQTLLDLDPVFPHYLGLLPCLHEVMAIAIPSLCLGLIYMYSTLPFILTKALV